MPQEDHLQINKKILSFIRVRGPSLPVHIAKEINTSILFTSAFLSELISEKELKISSLKVGNSSLYFIPGQEPLLEGFSHHLNNKEKEAFELLKQKKVLKDHEQHPAIRIALRNIKDFAIPFQKDNEVYWKYLIVSEQEFIDKIKKEEQKTGSFLTNSPFQEKSQIKEDQRLSQSSEKKPEIKIEQKHSKIEVKPFSTKKKIEKIKKRTSGKKGDKFFNKIKEFLSKKSIEIIDIEEFSKTDLILRVKIKDEKGERLLVAYNKKKINEKDVIEAYKKALKLKLGFVILSLGEPNKKLNEFIEAVKSLDGIEKIE